jgi:hypothetical protein
MTTPLNPTEFPRRLKELRELQASAANAYRVAAESILAYATEYKRLYEAVRAIAEGDVRKPLLRRLNETLHPEEKQANAVATRLRTIANTENIKRLRSNRFLKALPPALEPMYEVARALDNPTEERRVVKAISDGTLTQASTVRAIRQIKAGSSSPHNRSTNAHDSLRTLTVEFVSESVRTWDAIECFRDELTAASARHQFAIRVVRQEARLKADLQRFWQRKRGAKSANAEETEADRRP